MQAQGRYEDNAAPRFPSPQFVAPTAAEMLLMRPESVAHGSGIFSMQYGILKIGRNCYFTGADAGDSRFARRPFTSSSEVTRCSYDFVTIRSLRSIEDEVCGLLRSTQGG